MDLDKKTGIKRALRETAGANTAEEIWNRAKEILMDIEAKYKDLPEGMRMHASFIFPAAAVQLAAKEITGDEKVGWQAIASHSWAKSEKTGKALQNLAKIPGFQKFFIRVWDPVSKKFFGSESGFENVFYPKKKGEYRMDIIRCPYHTLFTELQVPELTQIFCINDEYSYGHIPGLKFERTTTLGTGGEKCDFCIRLAEKK